MATASKQQKHYQYTLAFCDCFLIKQPILCKAREYASTTSSSFTARLVSTLNAIMFVYLISVLPCILSVLNCLFLAITGQSNFTKQQEIKDLDIYSKTARVLDTTQLVCFRVYKLPSCERPLTCLTSQHSTSVRLANCSNGDRRHAILASIRGVRHRSIHWCSCSGVCRGHNCFCSYICALRISWSGDRTTRFCS